MAYQPNPTRFDGEPVPAWLPEVIDWLGQEVHACWAESRLREGWEYGPVFDGENKKHPCLIPYEQLPESEKDYDRNTARRTVQLLLHAGFQILPPSGEK